MEVEADSDRELLEKKQKRELKKINAARQKTQKRFEALLSIGGSGSEDVSERSPASDVKKKQRQRTKTADSGLTKSKHTPPKQRERSRSQENLLITQDDTDITSALEKPRKSKKKVDNADTPITSSVEKQKKKKKKPKPQYPESGEENDAFEKPSDDGNVVTKPGTSNYDGDNVPISENTNNDGDNVQKPEQSNEEGGAQSGGNVKVKGKKKRKKKKETDLSEVVQKALEKKRHDDGLLLCIVIHKADQVKPDAHVRHPLIRVHLVHMETGDYIKKTDSMRNVTSIFENKNENENIDYILPLLTQPYDFKTNRTLTPHWEEILVYNEIYSYFLQREAEDPPVIIFFELLDLMQMNLKQKEFAKTDKGWYRIAWAFLKVISPSGSTNTDRQVRLQFYQPLRRVRAQKDDNSSIEIFRWWKYGSRIKYPSTLYITVKGVYPPEILPTITRSMFPMQPERGAISYEELNSTLEESIAISESDATAPMWIKLPGQINRIPNKLEYSLPSGRKGCSVVQFSDNGRYLACACISNDGYPIFVYEFPDGKLVSTFNNHFGIVYDLCWSAHGKELLSASADSTVRCWDTKRFASTPVKLFPHPSFVYTCKYHTQAQNIVVTGGYDYVIRVWNKISDGLQAVLLRELCEHKGFVNTLAFTSDGRLFSADSVGTILEWSCLSEKKKKVDVAEMVNRWQLIKTIQLPELKNTTINTIHMHPGEKKLLVHSRDSMLRMLDLRSYGIAKVYIGGMNFKEHIRSSFSTCGSLVFCGTEYGLVHVWSTETAKLLHTYKELGFRKSISHVHFHPQDNFVVFCSYGDGHPILIYSYDPKLNLEERLKETSLTPQLTQDTSVTPQLTDTPKSLNEAPEMFRSLRTASMIANNQDRFSKINEKLMSVTAPVAKDLSTTKNRVTFKDLSPREIQNQQPDIASLSGYGPDAYNNFSPMISSSPAHGKLQFGVSNRIHEKVSSTPQSRPRQGVNESVQDSTLTMSQLESPTTDVARRKAKMQTSESTEYQTLVAMYDYQAKRPEELEFKANDIIRVIGKDRGGKLIGKLENGRQGYFPLNYLMEIDLREGEGGSKSPKEGETSTSYSAVVDRHGELKFISGNEESDSAVETRRSQKKRKQRRDVVQKNFDENPTV